MPSIECITSITGDKDFLRDDHVVGAGKFVCYTDNPAAPSGIYEMRPAYDKFKDPRRNSRIHKLMPHKYSQADVTIWHDGNTRFMVAPEKIVEDLLGDYDMAIFKHGARDCIYDEAMECAKLGLDDPEIIIEQAKHYEDEEYAKHKGLCSGFFIVRRNNKKTQLFNELWWADYCRYSRRDQISLMPAIDKSGVRVNFMPDRWVHENGFATLGGVIAIYTHKHFSGNFNDPNIKKV